MSKEPITTQGYDNLCKKLDDLTKKQRPETVIELDIARSHGDLKENAEYHAAKEKLAFIDKQIEQIGTSVLNSQIVDPSSYEHDSVKFGSTVEIEDCETEQLISYTIVGERESDINNNLLSIKTPLAKALMGKEIEDEISITLPDGIKDYEIIKIYYNNSKS